MKLPGFTAAVSLTVLVVFAIPVAAQEGPPEDGQYSWIILVGILIMLILFGAVLQLRKTKPAGHVKEEEMERVEEESEHPEKEQDS